MPLDFPASPSVGQVYLSWRWDGEKWVSNATGGGTLTQVSAGSGITASPSPIVASGSVSLTAPVTAVLGGTGQTSYAQGDILYANDATTLLRLPKSSTSPRYLSNVGVGNNPAWAQVDLSVGVTGILPIANGGTGGTGGLGTVTQITAGTGITLSPSPITASGTVSLTVPVSVANGGTGATTGNAGPYLPLVAGSGNALTGALTIAPPSGDAAIALTKPAGANNTLSGGAGSSTRWVVVLGDATAESGANAGSLFKLNSYTDGGVYLATPLSINRATGDVSLQQNLRLTAGKVIDLGSNYTLYSSGTIRRIDWAGNANFQYDAGNGDLQQVVGGLRNFFSRGSDGFFAAERGAVGGNGAYVNLASFAALKSDIRPIADPVALVKSLKPVAYTYKATGEALHGFVIEDLVAAYPETIARHPETGAPEGYRPEMIIAGLAAALQDALRRIEALEEK